MGGPGSCQGVKYRIDPSPRQAAEDVLPVTAVLRNTVRIKKSIFSSLANPAASGEECARYRGSTGQHAGQITIFFLPQAV